MTANDCPDREVLLAYHTGELPEAAAEEVIAHLGQCSTCQAALETFGEAQDSLVARLRRPEAELYTAEPQCREMLARVRERYEPSPAGRSGNRLQPDAKDDDGPSLEEFCRRLSDSGLMTAEEVEQFLTGLATEERPTTAGQLAQTMHRPGQDHQVPGPGRVPRQDPRTGHGQLRGARQARAGRHGAGLHGAASEDAAGGGHQDAAFLRHEVARSGQAVSAGGPGGGQALASQHRHGLRRRRSRRACTSW